MAQKVCDFPDCGRWARRAGLCRGHLAQRDCGHDLTPLRGYRTGCDIDGCDQPHLARGLCSTHYTAAARLAAAEIDAPECGFEGCDRPQRASGLCDAHRRQKGPLKPIRVAGAPKPPKAPRVARVASTRAPRAPKPKPVVMPKGWFKPTPPPKQIVHTFALREIPYVPPLADEVRLAMLAVCPPDLVAMLDLDDLLGEVAA